MKYKKEWMEHLNLKHTLILKIYAKNKKKNIIDRNTRNKKKMLFKS